MATARTPRQMQAVTEKPPEREPMIRVTARTDVGFEYHLTLPASAVSDILDPDVADAYIEVPVPHDVRSAKKRYLHTSRIAELDLHDTLPDAAKDDEDLPTPPKKPAPASASKAG